jgi:hypothetical protein
MHSKSRKNPSMTRPDKGKPKTIVLVVLIIALIAALTPQPLFVFWPVAAIVGTLVAGVAILKNSKHFSLKALFVITTIVAVAIAYSQRRRNKILRICEYHRTQGIYFTVPDSPIDFLWQRLPSEVQAEGVSNEDLRYALMSLAEYGDLSIRVRRAPARTNETGQAGTTTEGLAKP